MTIAFVGTGGHAKSVYDLVKKKKILFFDRKKKKFIVNNKVFNVISDLEISKKYRKKITKIIITIGNNKIRKKYYNFFKKKKINFATLIHPKSYSGIGSKIGEDRILQELAILAQKSDIHEELDRLQAHTKDCKKLLSSKGPHGKRIDFIAQELNREANTMGSKSTDIQSSRRALDLKILIEQIREQTQNIE